jgi:hypothetical protein
MERARSSWSLGWSSALLSLVLMSCQLGFQPQPLKLDEASLPELDELDTLEQDEQDLDEHADDEEDELSFECERFLGPTLGWSCVSAPRCAGRLLAMKVDDAYRSALICPDGPVLRWHIFENGSWQAPFDFGIPSDRPVVHRYFGGTIEQPGLVQRGAEDELIWVFRAELGEAPDLRVVWESALDTVPFQGASDDVYTSTAPWVFDRSDATFRSYSGDEWPSSLQESDPLAIVAESWERLYMLSQGRFSRIDLTADEALETSAFELRNASHQLLPELGVLLECGDGMLSVYNLEGSLAENIPLPNAGACLASVGGAAETPRWLVFFPNAGVILQREP